MVKYIMIVNKDSPHFGQQGIIVDEREELGNYYFLLMKLRTKQGSQNGRLVRFPDGENFFFSPREIEIKGIQAASSRSRGTRAIGPDKSARLIRKAGEYTNIKL